MHYKKTKTTSELIIYGKHPVMAALNNPRRNCKTLYTTKEIWQNIQKSFLQPNCKVQLLTINELNTKFPNGINHQNLILEVNPLPTYELEDILELANNKSLSCIVILDQVTDPHNIGAIIRSAAAFSADAVILTENNSPKENSTIIKCAAGASEITPMIKVTNLSSCLKTLKEHGFWIIGLDGNTHKELQCSMFSEKIAIVLGSEESGLRRLTQKNCDFIAKINISSNAESLNVSNAAAIALYEIAKFHKN